MASTLEVDQIKHSSGVTFTLPTADGSAGHLLKTNGSRVLSFTADTTGIASLAADTSPQLGGDLDCNGSQIQWSKGADVASATALVLLTDGNFFDVTGTVTITSFNTTGGPGTQIKLQFDAACLLTHHSTDLKLPGGANITTAAGDVAEFIEYAAGDYICTSYTKANGGPVLIPDDFVDSQHYATGSIDTAHIATNQIDETLMKDAFVGDFTDATVTASDYFIHGDATDSGNTKKDTIQGIIDLVPASGLPSSTVAVFFQAGAPTGWTKSTANNDKMLRVVSGTGGGTGGTSPTATPAHSLSAGAHVLSTSEIPSHTHVQRAYTSTMTGWSAGASGYGNTSSPSNTSLSTSATGNSNSHSHSLSGSITTPAYMDVIIATKD